VLDNSSNHAPVQNAVVSIVGTNRTATTNAQGVYTITNVPPAATLFTVTSPDPFTYYNYAQFQSKQYDTIQCKLPLPALAANTVAQVADVWLYNGGQNPPPPPPVGGCP
ncbi:MAG TPA: carboxypeptidase-like regulatory domain-containing protein, partial [Chthonomonadaceae bacterium]|nr:carboxypeptidase-like regulatory domain-containing protein [Chthonomonadaceae bacterium]